MPMYIVRSLVSLAGQRDTGQFIDAEDAVDAATQWRRQRDLPTDHPIAVQQDEMEYPEDDIPER